MPKRRADERTNRENRTRKENLTKASKKQEESWWRSWSKWISKCLKKANLIRAIWSRRSDQDDRIEMIIQRHWLWEKQMEVIRHRNSATNLIGEQIESVHRNQIVRIMDFDFKGRFPQWDHPNEIIRMAVYRSGLCAKKNDERASCRMLFDETLFRMLPSEYTSRPYRWMAFTEGISLVRLRAVVEAIAVFSYD